MAEPTPHWRTYRNRLGKTKGVAIVFRCSDIGLELKSCLWQEQARVELCNEIADALNRAFRKPAAGKSDAD